MKELAQKKFKASQVLAQGLPVVTAPSPADHDAATYEADMAAADAEADAVAAALAATAAAEADALMAAAQESHDDDHFIEVAGPNSMHCLHETEIYMDAIDNEKRCHEDFAVCEAARSAHAQILVDIEHLVIANNDAWM